MFKLNLKKIVIIASVWLVIFPLAVFAAGILPPESTKTNCGSSNCGNYSLNDFLLLAINVANWILGVVGAVALLFFVYGGFVFILSAGNEERVKAGKQILLNSIIGLAIVFASYTIIQFSMSLLGVQDFTGGKLPGLSDFFTSFSKKK
jgi:hypothetical protein